MTTVVRFSGFELDLRSRELRRRGVRVRLAGQPIDVLAMLVARPGEMVSREDLRAALWPSDTFVDFEHGLNTAISRLRAALGDAKERPRLIETLPRRGYRFVGTLEAPMQGTTAADRVRVAVLPFQNLIGDPEQDYWSDGLTDEIVVQLGCLPADGLAVIARSSVMRFKDGRTPLRRIASALRADYVIEGTVRRFGERLRVTVQLIHATDQCQVWARSFDCELANVLDVHAAVARAVAETTALRLSPAQRASFEGGRVVSGAAYEACLKGRYFWNRYGPDDFEKAIASFEEAIRLSPQLAAAYAGLADAHIMRAYTGIAPPVETCGKAREAAERAVALDPDAAESWVAIGVVRMTCDYDWRGAEDALARAAAIAPGSAPLLHYRSILRSAVGRVDEAIADARRALDLDPLSPLAYTNVGWRLTNARRLDEAADAFLQALELEPRFEVARFNLAETRAQQGRREEALNLLRSVEQAPRVTPMSGMLACGYAMAGDAERARAILDETLARARTGYVPPYYLATAHLWLGERERALESLEQAFAMRDPWLVFLRTDARLDPLRSDPRFAAIRSAMFP